MQKKILILGGANVHCKLVQAAKEMGLYTIVTDYLPNSPAKTIADKSYMLNITDIDGIVDMCKREGVNGVISTHLDPCQRPYQEICNRLGLPCYGTKKQFLQMTDKHAFKQMCKENNVDIIPEYTIDDVYCNRIEYPVFVKPVDSRGSRGQFVCWNKKETIDAVKNAKIESSNGDVLIEKYLGDADEVQITYFFVDGKAYLIRTVDSHRGSKENHLDKVVICSISPSKHTNEYLKNSNEKVVRMFKKMGYQNGPIFIQGFYDNGTFRFFDPGLRFPGVDYDKIYLKEYGIDLIKLMIVFALYGSFDCKNFPSDMYLINNKCSAVMFPVITKGEISAINGIDIIKNDPKVFSYSQRHNIGDSIPWSYNVNQRFAEINVIGQNKGDLINAIEKIYDTISVVNEAGNDMLYNKFDTQLI